MLNYRMQKLNYRVLLQKEKIEETKNEKDGTTKKEKVVIINAIYQSFSKSLVWSVVMITIQVFAEVLEVLLTYKILYDAASGVTDDKDRQPVWFLGCEFLGLILCANIQAITYMNGYLEVDRISARICCSLTFMIYNKILKVSTLNPSEFDEGKIINYIQIDANKLNRSIGVLVFGLDSFWNLFFALLLGFILYGWVLVVLIITFVAMSFVINITFKQFFKNITELMGFKDKTANFLNNVVKNLKYMKMMTWENYCFDRISAFRKNELKSLKRNNFISGQFQSLMWVAPPISFISMLTVQMALGINLYLAQLELQLKIFKFLSFGMFGLPYAINYSTDLYISLKRIDKFLRSEEIDTDYIKNIPIDSFNESRDEYVVNFQNIDFFWNKKSEGDCIKENDDKKKNKNGKNLKKTKDSFLITKDKSSRKESEIQEPLIEQQAIDNDYVRLDETITQENLFENISTTYDEKQNTATIETSKTLLSDKENTKNNDITFRIKAREIVIKPRQLIMIIGKIGSGKSSLIYSQLGEMSKTKGEVDITRRQTIQFEKNTESSQTVVGSISYLGQRPWLTTATQKKNILLNKKYDEEKFNKAIHFSGLEEDVKTFTEGVDKHLGEGGDTLSGGQKARVALAAAYYQNSDIYLLDEPLSALDANIASHIMEEMFFKEFSEKTRIMITHSMQHQKYADYIYVMDEGSIVDEGTFKEMQNTELLQKFQELKALKVEEAEEKTPIKRKTIKDIERMTEFNKENSNLEKLVVGKKQLDDNEIGIINQVFKSENQEIGAISSKTFGKLIADLGGYWILLTVFILCILNATGEEYAYLYLIEWAEDFTVSTKWESLGTYSAIVVISIIFQIVRSVIMFVVLLKVSRNVYNNMAYRILHAKIDEFIEKVPSGRIMNRFSKDIEQIDRNQGMVISQFLKSICTLIVTLAFISYTISWILIVILIPVFIAGMWMLSVYMKVRREIVRLEAITRSPIQNLVSDTTKGLPSIRSMKLKNFLKEKMKHLLTENLKNSMFLCVIEFWFKFRAAYANIFLIQVPCYITILVLFKNDMDPRKLAYFLFAIVNTVKDSISTIGSWGDFETSMVSYERCTYFEQIEPEKNYFKFDDEVRTLRKKIDSGYFINSEDHKNKIVSDGYLRFENVSARYNEFSEDVLKDISFEIKPKEKIGIIGITGAGKSSLIKILWKCLEPYKGKVQVDNYDISSVDLKDLRSDVMVVSQDTVQQEGTLRENMDPLHLIKNDDILNETLKKLDFKHLEFLEKGLQMQIEPDGSNLSQGEKQLICFSRTLINKKKVIILDEATANIDQKTEEVIQKAVENDFADSTMQIIAHRIQTILHCDKIMVLKNGKIGEFGVTSEMIRKEGSYLKEIFEKIMNI